MVLCSEIPLSYQHDFQSGQIRLSCILQDLLISWTGQIKFSLKSAQRGKFFWNLISWNHCLLEPLPIYNLSQIISLFCMVDCVQTQLLSRVQLFATPWIVACQGPLFTGLLRQEYWSEMSFLSAGASSSSVQFSRSVVSDSLRLHGLQHARPPCLSPPPGVHPDPCPLSRWCHPTTSSSVVPFSSCPQSFPASGSFQMSQLFTSGGQSYWSFSFNISPSNEYSGLTSFRMDWLDLLAVQGTLKSLLQHHSSKASILQRSALFIVQLSHPYMTTWKAIALTRRTFRDETCLSCKAGRFFTTEPPGKPCF